jgi:hypothetical protein
MRDGDMIRPLFTAQAGESGVVVIDHGEIVCAGPHASCASLMNAQAEHVDLHGGALSPGLLTYGSPLGLQEIQGEPSTADGYVFDPLTVRVPELVGGDESVIHAAYGLQFTTRDALYVTLPVLSSPYSFQLMYCHSLDWRTARASPPRSPRLSPRGSSPA